MTNVVLIALSQQPVSVTHYEVIIMHINCYQDFLFLLELCDTWPWSLLVNVNNETRCSHADCYQFRDDQVLLFLLSPAAGFSNHI